MSSFTMNQIQVHSFEITYVQGLDPIRVHLQNIAPHKGRLTVECYGSAWACAWMAMPEISVLDFVAKMSDDYLLSSLLQPLQRQQSREQRNWLLSIVRAVQVSLRNLVQHDQHEPDGV